MCPQVPYFSLLFFLIHCLVVKKKKNGKEGDSYVAIVYVSTDEPLEFKLKQKIKKQNQADV